MTDISLKTDWIYYKPAPGALLELVRCKCKRNKCEVNTCYCCAVGYESTSAYSCKQCDNVEVILSDEDEDEHDGDKDVRKNCSYFEH